jgi:hypothetical protein
MKSAREKAHDTDVEHQAVEAVITDKFDRIRDLFHGLKRTQHTHVAIESIDFEPIPGGQILVMRMLYPFHMERFELADAQIEELVNRAQGRTAGGVQIANSVQAAAILKQG